MSPEPNSSEADSSLPPINNLITEDNFTPELISLLFSRADLLEKQYPDLYTKALNNARRALGEAISEDQIRFIPIRASNRQQEFDPILLIVCWYGTEKEHIFPMDSVGIHFDVEYNAFTPDDFIAIASLVKDDDFAFDVGEG